MSIQEKTEFWLADVLWYDGSMSKKSLSIRMRSQNPDEYGWSMIEGLVIGAIFIAVIAGMSIWLKPWERWKEHQDRQTQKLAAAMAEKLVVYYNGNKQTWPWNYMVNEYIPTYRRGEAAYVYRPATYPDRFWREAFIDISAFSAAQKKELLARDQFLILKQVSGNSLVNVCFLPQSEEFKKQAALLCEQDVYGLRDAPYEVDGVDGCASVDGSMNEQNWRCETAQ
ncbi:hypothetical protein FWH30_01730 [Microgenomates group bacterium]|nr:hypothetical protein [Microgenomates group bacterium]